MTYVGADVESLRSAAAQMRSVADELDGHSQALTSMLGGIEWVGDVATRFLSNWTGGHRINLASTSQFFRQAADTLDRNAGEQQDASSGPATGGWSMPGTSPFPGPRLPGALLTGGIAGLLPSIGMPGLGWADLGKVSLETSAEVLGRVADQTRAGAGAWKSGFGWLWNENTGQGVRASFAHKLAPTFTVLSVAMVAIASYEGGLVERARLKGDPTLDGAEASARVAGAAATRAAVATGSIVASAKVGMMVGGVVGGPIGVVAGAAVGGLVGFAAEELLDVHVGDDSIGAHIGNVGADIGDAAVDGYRAGLEAVGDAVDVAGDALGEAADAVSDLKEKVWPF